VFVLYEGLFNQPSTYDYGFINPLNDSVKANLFQNSNSGANLPPFPDGMMIINNTDLFITCQGNFGGQGRMYRLDASTNKVMDTVTFGSNPFNFTYFQNNFYVANIGGSNVTKLNYNLDIVNTYSVGPNPKDAIPVLDRIYISKASYTNENSVGIIDIISNQVSKVYFPAHPVSVANNTGGIYISTYGWKKLYILDSLVATDIIDSISVNIPYMAIGDIIPGDGRTLYIVGISDTVFSSYIGKGLYKFDLLTRTFDPLFSTINMNGSDDIYGVAYEQTNKYLYIGNSKGFMGNGTVEVYNASTGALIKTYDIVGVAPKRFAFKY
jgi:hypothetical protein